MSVDLDEMAAAHARVLALRAQPYASIAPGHDDGAEVRFANTALRDMPALIAELRHYRTNDLHTCHPACPVPVCAELRALRAVRDAAKRVDESRCYVNGNPILNVGRQALEDLRAALDACKETKSCQ